MENMSIEFQGPTGRLDARLQAAQISVVPSEEWVYCEIVGDVLQLWSAPPCGRCVVEENGLERCRFHANTIFVARQVALL